MLYTYPTKAAEEIAVRCTWDGIRLAAGALQLS
jgi:hypothetical protein